MSNRIPRTAERLKVTWLRNNSACPAGTTCEVWKDGEGWHMEHNGKFYSVPVSFLRNDMICKFKEIA